MKTILVQAHELAIAHGISIEEAIAMLETLEGEDIWLIYHDCQEPHVASTKDKEKWIRFSIDIEGEVECPECGQYVSLDVITFEKAKLFPREHSSSSRYLKNRDRVKTVIADQKNKQWDETLIQSLLVRQEGIERVTVESCPQTDGTRLWAICSSPHVMSKEDGLWYFDPSHSNRPDNYQDIFRWDSAQDAFDFATKMIERNDAIALQEVNHDVS
jgi:hypothetical protein